MATLTFTNVVGHKLAKKMLISDIQADRIATAYLFTGPDHVGKRTLAIEFAKLVNTHQLPPEASHRISKLIDDGLTLDVVLVTPTDKGTIHIDQIRNLKEEASYLSSLAHRFFIIDDAHTMTQEAANALLKLLEEPPERTSFILITSREDMLPDTIKSRTRKIPFRRIENHELATYLRTHYPLHEKELNLIVERAEGSLTRALDIIEGKQQEKEALATEFLISPKNNRLKLLNNLNIELPDFLYTVESLLRTALLTKYGVKRVTPIPDELRTWDTGRLLKGIKLCEQAYSHLQYNVAPDLLWYYISLTL